MAPALALAIGGLYAAGIYMMLRRSIVKLLIGLGLLAHAANLLIFAVAGLEPGLPPLVPEGEQQLVVGASDPLPQALVLTAIVINFGVLAFAIALVHRVYQVTGTDDLAHLTTTDT